MTDLGNPGDLRKPIKNQKFPISKTRFLTLSLPRADAWQKAFLMDGRFTRELDLLKKEMFRANSIQVTAVAVNPCVIGQLF